MLLLLTLLLTTTAGQPYHAAGGRSPIPGPNESITEPIPFTQLAPFPSRPKPTTILPWSEAHLHIGQYVTVEGRIVDTHRLKNLTFLNFDKNWKDKFYIVVFTDAHDESFAPQIAYLHQTLRIIGEVSLHNARPQIKVHDIKQIEVLP